jgi:hypothetical protein
VAYQSCKWAYNRWQRGGVCKVYRLHSRYVGNILDSVVREKEGFRVSYPHFTNKKGGRMPLRLTLFSLLSSLIGMELRGKSL